MLTLGVLLALFHNFGFQMLFVGQDVSLPLCYCLLFTNPNGISNLELYICLKFKVKIYSFFKTVFIAMSSKLQ